MNTCHVVQAILVKLISQPEGVVLWKTSMWRIRSQERVFSATSCRGSPRTAVMTHEGSRDAQDAPERPQEAPQKPPRSPQEATKKLPRGPQEAPRRPRNEWTARAPDVHPAKREESTSGWNVWRRPIAERSGGRRVYVCSMYGNVYYFMYHTHNA